MPNSTRSKRQAVLRREALSRAATRCRAASAPRRRETIAARDSRVAIAPGTIVSGFMPLKSEINPLPLMRKLADAGAQLALPVVPGRGKPLIMRACAFGDALARRRNGASASRSREAPEVVPDILLVPLLAFDRAGHRIGYGAGYYDMTIARAARDEAGHRHRHRLRRAGNRRRCPTRRATRASISC